MTWHIPHIGLRTVKTGLAVALALLFADLRGSPAHIFAAIGAISAMSRSVDDSVASCRTQFFGILLGASFGTLFVRLFEGLHYFGIGLELIVLILLCVQLRLRFAVPLACIVFVSVCLSPASEALHYGTNRLLDTSIGLLTALAVNIAIKPYNNRAQIERMLMYFIQSAPSLVKERALYGHYPALTPLERQLERLAQELAVFEGQNVFHMRDRAEQAAFLRGCEQLARSILQELRALCAMDERGRISPENARELAILGLDAAEAPVAPCRSEADIVGNYHLGNLLRAYRYLSEFLSIPPSGAAVAK